MARQQAIYDELVANHELSGATPDLAGWTRPATTPARTSFYLNF